MKKIATAYTCFNQKFGIPRQSGLAAHAKGKIVFEKKFSHPEAFRGLKGMSHLWIIFHFHKAHQGGPTVRPPGLGGNKRQGVFATRAPFRPNNLGLSLVQLEDIYFEKGHAIIEISNHDLLNQTPIFDVKPYHPSDIISTPNFGWIQKSLTNKIEVDFSPKIQEKLKDNPNLKELIRELLQLDPKPAFHSEDSHKDYAMLIDNLDIHWRYLKKRIEVTAIKIIDENYNSKTIK